MTEIVRFDSACEAEPSAPAADRLIAGAPRQAVQNFFTDGTNQFFCGRWVSTPGKWRVQYTESEFCHLLSGRVRLVSAAGREESFGAGESFVVPGGYCGTWEVLEDCQKLYAIFAPIAS